MLWQNLLRDVHKQMLSNMKMYSCERFINSYRNCLLQVIVVKDGFVCMYYFPPPEYACWFTLWKNMTTYWHLLWEGQHRTENVKKITTQRVFPTTTHLSFKCNFFVKPLKKHYAGMQCTAVFQRVCVGAIFDIFIMLWKT